MSDVTVGCQDSHTVAGFVDGGGGLSDKHDKISQWVKIFGHSPMINGSVSRLRKRCGGGSKVATSVVKDSGKLDASFLSVLSVTPVCSNYVNDSDGIIQRIFL